MVGRRGGRIVLVWLQTSPSLSLTAVVVAVAPRRVYILLGRKRKRQPKTEQVGRDPAEFACRISPIVGGDPIREKGTSANWKKFHHLGTVPPNDYWASERGSAALRRRIWERRGGALSVSQSCRANGSQGCFHNLVTSATARWKWDSRPLVLCSSCYSGKSVLNTRLISGFSLPLIDSNFPSFLTLAARPQNRKNCAIFSFSVHLVPRHQISFENFDHFYIRVGPRSLCISLLSVS